MRSTVGLMATITLLLASGCGDDDGASLTDAGGLDAPSGADAGADGGVVGPPVVRFRVAAGTTPPLLDVPFPSDLERTGPGGTIPDDLGPLTNFGSRVRSPMLQHAFARLDGFGRNTGAMFLVDAAAPVDPATLVAGTSVRIFDVDATSPEVGAEIPCVAAYFDAVRLVVVDPDGVVLAPGRRYAVVLTTAVRTTAGEALGADRDFVPIRDGDGTARATAAGNLYGAAVDVLAAHGVPPSSVAGLSVFTTQTRHRVVYALREALVAGDFGPAPELDMSPADAPAPFHVARFGRTSHPGWTATLTEWLGDAPRGTSGHHLPGAPDDVTFSGVAIGHDAIGAVITGTMVVPELRRPFTSTSDPDDGTIAFDAAGHAIVQDATRRTPVSIVLPATTAPASGYPVVIFGHGGGGGRGQMLLIANELARAGIATAAIDGPMHGLRAQGEVDGGNVFAGSYRGPDGLEDLLLDGAWALELAGNGVNVARARDNWRQEVLEQCQLRRLLGRSDLDLSSAADEYGGAAPRIDSTRIAWIGESYGGAIGTILAAIEPGIDPFVLGVSTALLFRGIGEEPFVAGSVDGALLAAGVPASGVVPATRHNPFLDLIQGAFDGIDPASFARDATHPASGTGPSIYALEVVHDESAWNYGTELLAREMELPRIDASPVTVSGLVPIAAPVSANVGGRTRALEIQTIATHFANVFARVGHRTVEAPFPLDDPRMPFVPLAGGRTVEVRQPIVASQRSIVHFLETAWSASAPEIDVTGMETWLDFDDDGWTDDEERAATTDPFDATSHPAGAAPHPRDVGF